MEDNKKEKVEVSMMHFPGPYDELTLKWLRNFPEYAENGILRCGWADMVYVIDGSEQHKKIRESGYGYYLGEVVVNGVEFVNYSLNRAFFKSKDTEK